MRAGLLSEQVCNVYTDIVDARKFLGEHHIITSPYDRTMSELLYFSALLHCMIMKPRWKNKPGNATS